MENDKNIEMYTVNLNEVAMSKEILPTIRLLAMDLIKNPYISLGDYFNNISDNSLTELVNLVNEIDEDETKLEDMLLLTMMLSQAEGNPVTDSEKLTEMVNLMRMIICGVSLNRKGMVKLYYENLSLADDMRDKIIMTKM